MMDSHTEFEKNLSKPLPEPAPHWFVNREWELQHFWKWINDIPEAIPRRSYAMTGVRRVGKTAVIHRLFNRLFTEQPRVMPIYISFASYLNPNEQIDSFGFANDFFAGYLRSFLAFRHGRPELLRAENNLDELFAIAETIGDKIIQRRIKSYKIGLKSALEHPPSALFAFMRQQISVPDSLAYLEKIPTVVFIDEYQVLTRVFDPIRNNFFNLTNAFQKAAESEWAPLIVSGSSLSMMVHDALGGMVVGRFRRWHLNPLNQSHTREMIKDLGTHNKLKITTELSTAIWDLTEGYPYPIEAILNSECPDLMKLPDLTALEEIVAYEMSGKTGELHAYYDTEYGKYISEINGDNVTRQVLLWLTENSERLGEKEIFVSQIMRELGSEEQNIIDAFDILSKADIVERYNSQAIYGIRDPMLRRYIHYYHKLQATAETSPEQGEAEAIRDLRADYQQRMGMLNQRVGKLAEAVIGDVMSAFDGRILDGSTFFNVSHPVEVNRLHNLQRRTGIIQDGVPIEIDLMGEHPSNVEYPGNGAWMVQVRYTEQKTTKPDVEKFMQQAEAVRVERGFKEANRWYFSKRGFTEPALELLQAEGVYHNDLDQFNLLAEEFNFMGLPQE